MTASYELKDKIRSCRKCRLCEVGNGPVPFFGRRSDIMIVGEAPGRSEDEKGRPLVGPAGKLLWAELKRVGIEREDVLRANAVSCYPGRTPNDSEIWACRGNLYEQVKFCDPKWILAVGRVANWSFGKKDSMSQIHGEWYWLGWFPGERQYVLPTYHPAAVLRDRTLTRVWREDLKTFARKIKGAKT